MKEDLFYYNPHDGAKFNAPVSRKLFIGILLTNNICYFNPYTGDKRHPLDIESDPYGRAIVNSFKNIKVPNKNMSDVKNQNSTQETIEGDPMSEDTPKSYKRVGQFKVSNDILYDDSGNIELDTFVNEMFSRVKVLEAIDVYDQGYTLYKGICEEFDGVEFIPYKGPHKTLITITIGELPEYQFVVSKMTSDLINLSKGTEDQSHQYSYKFEKV
jgi:hypothetical protein